MTNFYELLRSLIRLFIKVFNGIKQFVLKNFAAFIFTLLAIIGTFFIVYYLQYIDPDIRYAYGNSVKFEFVDRKIDNNGDFIFNVNFKIKYKNLSFKKGFVDNVEFVPISIRTLPYINTIHIDKIDLGWRDEQIIEIRAIFIVPVGFIGPLREKKQILVEIKSFDSIGRLINRLEDGALARIKFDLKGEIEREIIKFKHNSHNKSLHLKKLKSH